MGVGIPFSALWSCLAAFSQSLVLGAEAAGAGWATTAEQPSANAAMRLQRLIVMVLSCSDVVRIRLVAQRAQQFQHPL
jgi:hypothetical protein